MGVLKKLAGQTAIYGISSIVGRVINLVLLPLHTRVFQEGQYGLISYFYTQTAFLNVILTFGMETTFFRFLQEKEDSDKVYNQAFTWVMLLALLMLCLIIPFAKPLSSWMGYPNYHRILIYMSVILALDSIAALPMAMLRHQERPLAFASITLVSIFLNIGLNLFFLLVLNKGIEYVFIANIVGSFAKAALALFQNLPSGLLWEKSLLIRMLNYGGFIMLAGLAGTANQMLDRLMIPYLWEGTIPFLGKSFTGEELNGIYSASYRLAMLIALFTQAYRYAAEPFFFRSAEDKNSPETFARVFHYYTLATLSGFLLIASFSQEIVSFDLSLGFAASPINLIDSKFWLGLVIVPILLFAYVFHGMYFNFSIWFKITKQTRYALLFTGTGAVCAFIINFWGIPQFGFFASAWGALFCFGLMAFLAYITGQRHYPIPYRLGRMAIYVVCVLVAFRLNLQIGPANGFSLALIFKILVCIAFFAAIFWVEKLWPISWSQTSRTEE